MSDNIFGYNKSADSTTVKHMMEREGFLSEEKLGKSNENHKPVFTNCSMYAPVIKEEQPLGTFVIQVHAEDNDPSDEGGTVTYSLFESRDKKLKFGINNKTGVINTTEILDRDEPNNEKEIYLTVFATDNGTPQLTDACTFKVTIEDENDNHPLFDDISYEGSVPKDLQVGDEVMRVFANDIDDGKNSVVRYYLTAEKEGDDDYFKIDDETGVIYLKKIIDKNLDYHFSLIITSKDQGPIPKMGILEVDLRLVESFKQAPSFLLRPTEPIKLFENFSDFSASIARVEAVSNIAEAQQLQFVLDVGLASQNHTFRLESTNNTADIKLAKFLDYERDTAYSLIVRVSNDYNLSAETTIDVEVLDVNDNAPIFYDLEKVYIWENNPIGLFVMQVRAIDADGTSANNQVTYELKDFENLLTIDKYSGNITTINTFDREVQEAYDGWVVATDNSPSVFYENGDHNRVQQLLRIEIIDRNDKPAHFTQAVYTNISISEDANINSIVVEVKVLDEDIISDVTYSITEGNINDSFYIEDITGKIRVNNRLDYETISEYNLTVKACDSMFDDTTTVNIFIKNVNDNPPVFEKFNANPMIEEQKLSDDCITTVVAYDPDIKDRNADQHIVYSILKDADKTLWNIDKSGCFTLKKPLDRDLAPDHPFWTVMVLARDEDDSPTALQEITTVNVTLIDINDNAPYLDVSHVVWTNTSDKIIELKARDEDSDENGPPFVFRIDETADEEIKTKFSINDTDLYADAIFDREKHKKSYNVPIAIVDSGNPPMTGTSTLTVIFNDGNNTDASYYSPITQVALFGLAGNCLIALIVCLVFLVLLAGNIVGYRKRKTRNLLDEEKDNVINYEKKGYSEVDSSYDLNAVRVISEDGPIEIAPVDLQAEACNKVLEFFHFLDDKKDKCDNDLDTNSGDNVTRYYYEGEGSCSGSLSTLISHDSSY